MVAKNLKEAESRFETLHIRQRMIFSEYLEREVAIEIYLPGKLLLTTEWSLLLINDGQDLPKMNFGNIIHSLINNGKIQSLLCVGIYCGEDRINEYGTVYRTDYMGRGTKGGLYSKFILDELLPFLKNELAISTFKDMSFAGFSMGGLSALDIVWNNPDKFKIAGVFSGSLWWRRKGYEDKDYDYDKDRIMHLQVQKGTLRPGLKFFFECGRLDETADRNNNGIIDSIEDTTDLIDDLKELGYSDTDIRYLELEEGRHNVETWAYAFPEFLTWGWGTK